MCSTTRLIRKQFVGNPLPACHKVAAFLALICGVTSHCHAGSSSLSGEEQGLWDRDGFVVLAGVIRDIHRRSEVPDNDAFLAILEPEATLCGNFDPSLHPSLPVRLTVDSMWTSIKVMPPEGATVVAVIIQGDKFTSVAYDGFRFMPGSSALITIAVLGDPKVTEILVD